MGAPAPPPAAAWEHREARRGFEVVFLTADDRERRAAGRTAAVEAGVAWAVAYELVLATDWTTRRAEVTSVTSAGSCQVSLTCEEPGRWTVDGAPAPHLDGCLDVDLESSVLTNAFPVQHLALAIGQGADAPAAYVRAEDLRVERLEQRYVRLPDDGPRRRYRYAAPAFAFECDLVYDEHGLLLDYPGIAVRVA